LSLPYAGRGAIIQNDMISSLEQLDFAVQRHPSDIQSVYFRATNLLDLGYLDRAEAEFRRCLELDSSYGICRRFLSFVLLYKGDADEASELFETGMLEGQSSYRDVFVNYYGAIGDSRALILLLSKIHDQKFAMRGARYRFQTDNSYDLAALNADIRTNALLEPDANDAIDDISVETLSEGFLADFLWSPYLPVSRRPELRAEYLEVRKRKIHQAGIYTYWRKFGFPPQCRPMGDDDFVCD
jgi:tetratricopeptide (TPR) repeat protein